MIHLKKHLDILGKKVKCKVTGFEGIATSIGFDLYGCIQVIVNPGIDKDGKQKDQHWFDIARLKILSDKPVMPRPEFDFMPAGVAAGRQGPAEKPAMLEPSRPWPR